MRVEVCAVAGLVALLGSVSPIRADITAKERERIGEAAAVLKEIRGVPDKDIPQELWGKAHCVAVIPSMKKAAFVIGGEYGKGLVSCRKGGGWSAPAFFKLEKGSFGLQIGGQSIDLVMLIMNDRGMSKLLEDKFTLGADAAVAAGPVGRNAQAATDLQMHAEILSYSRARGLFAGISLAGAVVKADPDDNRDLYGRVVSPREILIDGTVPAPAAAAPFMTALGK